VSSVEPRALGRRKDTLVLDAKREKLIASTIREIYLKPERPTMTYLIEQVRARCAQKGLPLPDRRTMRREWSRPRCRLGARHDPSRIRRSRAAHQAQDQPSRRCGVAYLFPSSPFGGRLANDRQSRHPQCCSG
jgi:hypothetical protein